MKTENIVLAFLGIFGLLFFFMWWQRQGALMMAGQQTTLGLNQQNSNLAWRATQSNNETVGGVVNNLANSGTLTAIADAFSNIFGGGGSGGGGGEYYDDGGPYYGDDNSSFFGEGGDFGFGGTGA